MTFSTEPLLTITATPHGFRLETVQRLPRSREEIFAFFADAFELEKLTPPWLHFSVVTPAPIELRAGTTIDYRLRLHGFPLRWRSRISVWAPPHRFVDEQVHGPYRRWRHEHRFEETDGGTHCHDAVDYALYGGWVAKLLHIDTLFVQRDLRRIFAYRQQRLHERFGSAVD